MEEVRLEDVVAEVSSNTDYSPHNHNRVSNSDTDTSLQKSSDESSQAYNSETVTAQGVQTQHDQTVTELTSTINKQCSPPIEKQVTKATDTITNYGHVFQTQHEKRDAPNDEIIIEDPPQATTQVQPQATPQIQSQVTPQIQPQGQTQMPPQIQPQVPSQMSQQVQAQISVQVPLQVPNQLPPQVQQVSSQIQPQVSPQVQPQVAPQVQVQVLPQVQAQVPPQVQTQVPSQVQTQVSSQMTSHISPQMSQVGTQATSTPLQPLLSQPASTTMQVPPSPTLRSAEVLKGATESTIGSSTASVGTGTNTMTSPKTAESSMREAPIQGEPNVPQGYPYAQYPRYYDYTDRSRSLSTPYGTYFPSVPPHATNPRLPIDTAKSQPDLGKPIEERTMMNVSSAYSQVPSTTAKTLPNTTESKGTETMATTTIATTASRDDAHIPTAFSHPTSSRYPGPYPPGPYDRSIHAALSPSPWFFSSLSTKW